MIAAAMESASWVGLWKWFLILGVTGFAVTSIWVIIWGGRDVLQLLRELRQAAQEEDQP